MRCYSHRTNKHICAAATKFVVLAAFLIIAGCRQKTLQKDFHFVNFKTLDRLTRPLQLPGGERVMYVHYRTAGRNGKPAREGKEGVGTVDDAARAVLAYTHWYELTGDTSHFAQIRGLVAFIQAMQQQDGAWNKWVRADGTVGGKAKEPQANFGNTAARAIWALGRTFEVFHEARPELAYGISAVLERTWPQFEKCLSLYPQVEEHAGLQIPKWLPYMGNGDVASEMVLGLLAYHRANPLAGKWDGAIDKLAAGMAMLQQRDENQFAYGVHFSLKTYWHGWSNAQVHALTEVYRASGRPEMLASARREADHFYPWLLREQFAYGFDWERAKDDRRAVLFFPQRVEHIRPVVLGCLALYRATGEAKYAHMAGEAAAWLLGKNAAHEAVYDPATGLASAYIKSRNHVAPFATAEATAEALLVLMEVGNVPEALAGFKL